MRSGKLDADPKQNCALASGVAFCYICRLEQHFPETPSGISSNGFVSGEMRIHSAAGGFWGSCRRTGVGDFS